MRNTNQHNPRPWRRKEESEMEYYRLVLFLLVLLAFPVLISLGVKLVIWLDGRKGKQ
jgi:hypothetical protein